MARSEARISVSIWDDSDFLALTGEAQRLFLFLCSQSDLAHDGIIALRERRWSKKAAGLTAAAIADSLTELEKARFVIIDEDAEELLVRSFIRRDKVFRQPNVLRSAADHLKGVTSLPILRALAAELDRIGSLNDIPAGSVPILAEMRAIVRSVLKTAGDEGQVIPSPEATGKATAGTPGERGVVTAVTTASPSPVPRAPDPRPRPSAGGRASAREPEPAAAPQAPPSKPNATPPPDRCPNHLDDPDPPDCGRCAGARKARRRWDIADAERRRNAPPCRTHRGQPAHNCALCRADQLAAEEA